MLYLKDQKNKTIQELISETFQESQTQLSRKLFDKQREEDEINPGKTPHIAKKIKLNF